ncbi:MAG TPA: N-acetylneuraminate synthase family protein [bacterium]|nr:N-acetylneuraminate synthase family protein [bacterium]
MSDDRRVSIGGVNVSDESGCYVIAEIGHNHQGNLESAKELFRAAKECGAHAVKLQKRDNRTLYTKATYDAPYDNDNSYGATYGAHREALEFGASEYRELKSYAEQLGVAMFATVFDFASVDFMEQFDPPAYKIASGDLKNTPLLKYAAKTGKPILLSTGGGDMEDVLRARDAVEPINPQLCILQCTANYPSTADEMNLRVIETFRELFPKNVIGLSDHQSGISMALVAYVMGARIIEKHFTLNRASKGSDHKFSLEPIGLRKLVRDLERARVAMGDGEKKRLQCEQKPLLKMEKQLVAARDIPSGSVLTAENVAIKSPGGGLPPHELDNVIGKTTVRALKEDESISFQDLARQ